MRILGETWSVDVVEISGHHKKLGNRYIGMTDYSDRRVLLMSADEPMMKKTMLHELIHLLFDKTELSGNNEGDVVRCENVMWAIMKDNRELFDWIMSD